MERGSGYRRSRWAARAVGAVAGLSLLAALAGCAPAYTNSTYAAPQIGQAAPVSYGVIVSMRPVVVRTPNNGVGMLAGAAAGGAAGSFIGGDPRSNILGGIGGAVVGGLLGNAIQNQVSTGQAVEFLIREDNGQLISVVQTNENGFVPGQRVAIIHGPETRLAPAG